MNFLKRFLRIFEGIGFALLKFEPDSVKIPRIEAEIAEKEAHANQALEQFGSLIAADENEAAKLAPKVQQLEAQIQQLLGAGQEEAAQSLVEKFDDLDSEFKAVSERLNSNKTALRVEYEQTQRDIEKLRKILRTIKDGSKRVAAEEKLNDLRKAASGKRFETAGLTDDLSEMQERIEDRSNKVRGTRMVLDLGTEKSASDLAADKAIDKAGKQARLARVASQRNIQLKSVEKSGTMAPLGATPEVLEEKPKA